MMHFRQIPNIELDYPWMIRSKADFGIYTEDTSMHKHYHMLVVIEKPMVHYGFSKAERQLAGDMLTAAICHADFKLADQEIFGMVFQGPGVRFYRTSFTSNSLQEFINDKVPPYRTVIHCYPSNTAYPLSMVDPNQREMIIQILCGI